MNFKKIILLALILLAGMFRANAQVHNPVSWSVAVTADQAVFTAEIEAPWHMYDLGPYEMGPNPTAFTFELPAGVTLDGEIGQLDNPERKYDEIFGVEIGTYAGSARFVQKFKVTDNKSANIKATVEWQACDESSCLPPSEHEFSFKINPAAAGSVVESAGESSGQTVSSGGPATVSGVVKGDSRGLWSVIIEAILWGFAALLTPCVFPMVPMTVSFFLKNAGNRRKSRAMASFYGISIVALYTVPIAVIILVTYFVGGATITADIFNWLATHWVPNVLFFLIFMIFAASFFGAFEITIPSRWVNKSDTNADRGGLFGTFFMALTLVLVSFSCTGPIVGTILVKSTQGEIWEPIITMLAFAIAFSLPFTLFAFFPSLLKNLPKSGGWLNSVKVVLGFIELALGLKFLSVADQTYHWGILDREVYLALWVVIFTMLGFYLLGKIRFKHDDKVEFVSVKRLFLSLITFAFVAYMIPGMFGAPLKVLSGYMPPLSTQDFIIPTARTVSTGVTGAADPLKMEGKPKYSDFLHFPPGMEGFFDYEEGMQYARRVGKPVMLDFTGHGCVNCREMEANVWSDPAVWRILTNDYVIIALYVDDKKTLPESQWVRTPEGKTYKTLGKINAAWQIEKFGVNAQPYYVLMDNKGELLTVPRAYSLNISEFVRFLEEGLSVCRSRN